MTPALRTARTCTVLVVLSTAFTGYSGTISLWLAVPSGYVACLFCWCASRAYNDHRRVLARHRQEQRAAAGPAELPRPCCSFWQHSDGAVHAPGCTRPAAARRDDYRLDPDSRHAFDEIAFRYDDRSSA